MDGWINEKNENCIIKEWINEKIINEYLMFNK